MASGGKKFFGLFGGKKREDLDVRASPGKSALLGQENRPKVKEVLITYQTEENLFRLLKPKIESEIGKMSFIEDSNIKDTCLQLNCKVAFTKFDPNILEKLEESFSNHKKLLFGTPLIHLHFTSCNDITLYNRTSKADIENWLDAIEKHDLKNWLLIHVTQHASTTRKGALNSINAVIDTIRNDFIIPKKKSANNFFQLILPEKGNEYTEKRFKEFTTFLFTQMKTHFTLNCDMFETLLSEAREDQGKSQWSFFHYFLMQEQLCFAFEHIGLLDAALVSYDELEELLHFLIIKISNSTKIPNRYMWYEKLQESSDAVLYDYPHIKLSLDQSHDPSMVRREISLFKLRSVLFEKQATLLFTLGKAWDVGQRALKLLKDLKEESDAIKYDLPDGLLSAWSYLMCKNVLDVILDQLSNDSLSPYFSKNNTQTSLSLEHEVSIQGPSQWVVRAQLWHLQLNKLHELGVCAGFINVQSKESGYLHKRSSSRWSESSNTIKTLWGSMSNAQEDTSEALDLLNMLTSNNTFNRAYINLAELLIGALKHAGRKRMAMHASMNFAKFLINNKDLSKAEDVLSEACKLYFSDKWPALRLNALTLLAASQDTPSKHPQEYLTTCALLASTPPKLNSHSQQYFFDIFNKKIKDIHDNQEMDQISIQFSVMFKINAIKCCKLDYQAGDTIQITLVITNKSISEIEVKTIKLFFTGLGNLFSPISSTPGYWTQNSKFSNFEDDNVQIMPEKKTNSVRKKISGTPREADSFEFLFTQHTRKILPGINEIELESVCKIPGNYRPQDLLLDLKTIYFRHSEDHNHQVLFPIEPEIVVEPAIIKINFSINIPGGYLLIGKISEITINIINEGKTIILEGSKLTFESSRMLDIKVLIDSVTVKEGIHYIMLPDIKVGATHQIKVQVYCDSSLLVKNFNEDYDEIKIVRREKRLELSPIVDLPDDSLYLLNPPTPDAFPSACVLHITATCHWVAKPSRNNYGVVLPLSFYQPFYISHERFSCGEYSFVKIAVKCTTPLPIKVHKMKMKEGSPLKHLTSGQTVDTTSILSPGQVINIMYQVDKDYSPVGMQHCQFQTSYSLKDVDEELHYIYKFALSDVQTIFVITSGMEIADKDLTIYQDCILIMKIRNCREIPRQWKAPVEDVAEVVYDLEWVTKEWQIESETRGSMKLQSMKNSSFELKFKMRPTSLGELSIPKLHLELKLYKWNQTQNYLTAQFSESNVSNRPATNDIPFTMVPLNEAQVYNACKALVINILPTITYF